MLSLSSQQTIETKSLPMVACSDHVHRKAATPATPNIPRPAIFMAPVGCGIAAAPVLPLELAVPVPVDWDSFLVVDSLGRPVVSSGLTPVEVEEPDPVLLDSRAMAGSCPLVAFGVDEAFLWMRALFVPVLVGLSDLLLSVVFAGVLVGALGAVMSARSCAYIAVCLNIFLVYHFVDDACLGEVVAGKVRGCFGVGVFEVLRELWLSCF